MKKELEVVFSVPNHDPFNPPKLKAEGATIFRNAREVNTHRQVGNNFHTILSKPTNLTTAERCLTLQKGPGSSLPCLFPSSILPSSCVNCLPVCLFCCLAPALQAFASENPMIQLFFKSLLALLTDTSSRT